MMAVALQPGAAVLVRRAAVPRLQHACVGGRGAHRPFRKLELGGGNPETHMYRVSRQLGVFRDGVK